MGDRKFMSKNRKCFPDKTAHIPSLNGRTALGAQQPGFTPNLGGAGTMLTPGTCHLLIGQKSWFKAGPST